MWSTLVIFTTPGKSNLGLSPANERSQFESMQRVANRRWVREEVLLWTRIDLESSHLVPLSFDLMVLNNLQPIPGARNSPLKSWLKSYTRTETSEPVLLSHFISLVIRCWYRAENMSRYWQRSIFWHLKIWWRCHYLPIMWEIETRSLERGEMEYSNL
jgi:hypothetical protein